MNGAVRLLSQLQAHGVEFSVSGDRVKWRGAENLMTPERLTVLRDNKAEVVAYLTRPETFPHGTSITGKPRTWTGKVVSIEQWRRMSEWDRHGPNGRHWCGICKAWVQPDHQHDETND